MQCDGDGVSSVVRLQFEQDIANVSFDCIFANIQAVCYNLI